MHALFPADTCPFLSSPDTGVAEAPGTVVGHVLTNLFVEQAKDGVKVRSSPLHTFCPARCSLTRVFVNAQNTPLRPDKGEGGPCYDGYVSITPNKNGEVHAYTGLRLLDPENDADRLKIEHAFRHPLIQLVKGATTLEDVRRTQGKAILQVRNMNLHHRRAGKENNPPDRRSGHQEKMKVARKQSKG